MKLLVLCWLDVIDTLGAGSFLSILCVTFLHILLKAYGYGSNVAVLQQIVEAMPGRAAKT